MTDTTPQAAQVLTDSERKAIYLPWINSSSRGFDGLASQFEAAILAKLQAATPSSKPLFASSVAARKWAELQAQSHRMQSISFDGGPGGAGTIDPWGVVRWATPVEPLIVKGALSGMVDAQVKGLWPARSATPAEPAHQSTHWTEHEPVRLAACRVGRVYLAGPMTGYAEFNFPAFNAEAALLRGQGLSVLNPADHGIVDGAGWADYLRHDIAGLASCERIHLLRGWSQSKGAALEVTIAKAIGMAITFQDGAEPSQPVELPDERAAFEVWYASHASNKLGRPFSPHDFYELREGDGYGDAGYLNGAWHGYRAALASVKAPTHTDQAKKDAT